MLKRVVFSLIAGLFGFLMVAFSAISLAQGQVSQQLEDRGVGAPDIDRDEAEDSEDEGEDVDDVEFEETEERLVQGEMDDRRQETEDYYLAYPGILPDHPLYFLKMFRDRVRLTLTREPVAKARLMLLFADKRIGASLALAEGGKGELGANTALKAEKYLERAAAEAAQINESDLWQALARAGLKHYEVLVGVEGAVGEGDGAVSLAKELNGSVLEKVRSEGKVEMVMPGDEVSEDPEILVEEEGGEEEETSPVEIGL